MPATATKMSSTQLNDAVNGLFDDKSPSHSATLQNHDFQSPFAALAANKAQGNDILVKPEAAPLAHQNHGPKNNLTAFPVPRGPMDLH